MSHTLKYPYTEEERVNFIVEYNHNQGLRIETVDNIVKVDYIAQEEKTDEETQEVIQEEITEQREENHPTYYALEPNEIMEGDEPVINPNYEKEQEQKEKEHIAMLSLTAADVERGIYKAKGMDFDDIIAMVTQLQPEGLDIKALKIELKANNFYRGNPYVDAVGSLLGFTKEQLDEFFADGNYEHLLPTEEQTEKISKVEEVIMEEMTL